MSENAFPHYRTDTFQGTVTGLASVQTPEVTYYRDGQMVHLSWDAWSGTSNATGMTLTGLPAQILPSEAARDVCQVTDAGATAAGVAEIVAGSSIITFRATAVGVVFTATGTKGVSAHTMSYRSVLS